MFRFRLLHQKSRKDKSMMTTTIKEPPLTKLYGKHGNGGRPKVCLQIQVGLTID